jgi:hypothetical protein
MRIIAEAGQPEPPGSEAARQALSTIERDGLPAWVRTSPVGTRAAAVRGFTSVGLIAAAAMLVRAGAVAAQAGLDPPARRARLAELEDDFLRENGHYRARLGGGGRRGGPADT